MSNIPRLQVEAVSGNSIACIARLRKADASAIQQADIASIARNIFELTADDVSGSVVTDALVVADVVYDTLQTGGTWTVDATGYNFLDTVPYSKLATAGATYLVQYRATLSDGQTITWEYEPDMEAVFGGGGA